MAKMPLKEEANKQNFGRKRHQRAEKAHRGIFYVLLSHTFEATSITPWTTKVGHQFGTSHRAEEVANPCGETL